MDKREAFASKICVGNESLIGSYCSDDLILLCRFSQMKLTKITFYQYNIKSSRMSKQLQLFKIIIVHEQLYLATNLSSDCSYQFNASTGVWTDNGGTIIITTKRLCNKL